MIDVNHRTGEVDAAFRPNQIFAVGGLPFQLLDGARRADCGACGGKALDPARVAFVGSGGEAGYASHYSDGVLQRDGAYDQGTVWPRLIGPFVEARVRVLVGTNEAKRAAHPAWWSVGEALRVHPVVLREQERKGARASVRFNGQKSEGSRITIIAEPAKAEVGSRPRSLVAAWIFLP